MNVQRLDFSNPSDVEKISERIKISYKKMSGRDDGDDDAAQEILCRMLEGKHQHSTVDQAVIDYIRTRTGRKGSPGFAARKDLEYAITNGQGDDERPDIGDPRDQSFAHLDGEAMLRHIGDSVDRACYTLLHKWGMSEVEIAHIFGVSESRICQRLKRVQGRLSTRIAAQKSSYQRKTTDCLEGVLREKTIRNGWRLEQITDQRLAIVESFGMASFDETCF